MKKYLSLHIGVNKTDKTVYAPTSYSELCGCVNDAGAMRDIAAYNGFDVMDVLKDQTATFDAVVSRIRSAITELKRGGIFLLTFSGHGAHINGREPDNYDEGFVLHDLILKDNYIDVLLRSFSAAVKIILVADCCHSRTIYSLGSRRKKSRPVDEPDPPGTDPCRRNKRLDAVTSEEHQRSQRERYRELDKDFKRIGYDLPKHHDADVVVLTACDDNEKTGDGPEHGVFTGCLLDVLRHGGNPPGSPFAGTYRELMDAIKLRIGNAQKPDVDFLGQNRDNDEYPFFQGPPFTIVK